VRGLVLAGVFATAMGSLSAALNALATSATNDWYIPYFARAARSAPRRRRPRVHRRLRAADDRHRRVFAYAKVNNPDVRIIPVVLGDRGFILGPMLGVFLLGMFTRSRGSDRGNMIAITIGLIATIVLGHLHVELANLIAGPGVYAAPSGCRRSRSRGSP
jgi:Na+/proline symporter